MVLLVLISAKTYSQNPVSWTYSAKKMTDKTYKISLTGTIQSGWHLYSQSQPVNAISTPTKIGFTKNPLLIIKGKIKELGKLEKKKYPDIGVEAWQYSGRVDFVQTIELKRKAKTNINGTIVYQVCTEEKCLPPKTIDFTIEIK